MASMDTSSVKLLALVTILLAVFAQEAVEGKTHFLYWEVSPQSTLHLQKNSSVLIKFLYLGGIKKLLKQSHKHPRFLFLFSVELYTHLTDQYWRHMQILTHSFVLLFFVIYVVHKPLVAIRRKSFGVGFDMLSVTCCRLRTQHIPQIVTL
jgi:hypothetical protein